SGALPSDLPEPERARLSDVTEHVSVSARSSGEAFRTREDLFEYMLDHPEFATHVIRALEIGRYRIWREPEGLWLDDGAGALVRFWIAYAAPGRRVFYMQGRYQPAILPAIRGRVVAVVGYAGGPAGRGERVSTAARGAVVRADK